MNFLPTRNDLIKILNENTEFNEKLSYFTPEEQESFKIKFITEAEETLNEISWGGVKNVVNLGREKVANSVRSTVDNVRGSVKDTVSNVKDSVDSSIKGMKDAYYTGNIQELEAKLLEIVIESVNKINEKRKKMGQPPISPKSVLTSISNKAAKLFK